jgi:hypothetical protein
LTNTTSRQPKRSARVAITGSIPARSADEGGSDVLLLDAKGNPGVDLETNKHGSSVVITDEKGTRRAVLGSVPLESVGTGSMEVIAPSSLTLLDKDGNVAWKAP